MNLAMMRDINAADPIGGLGPRVTPAPTPAPAPVRRPDGIVVGSDGKMSTDLPLPPGMEAKQWWWSPTGTAAPAAVREPLKVGDKVRSLVTRSVFVVVDAAVSADGAVRVRRADGKEIPCRLATEGKNWERIHDPA